MLLNNLFEDYWHICIKRKCINGTILRAYCKYIGLYSRWNERKSVLRLVRGTYIKINFGLGPNAREAGPCEIIEYLPVPTSSVNLRHNKEGKTMCVFEGTQ